jgi:hypothetical protein
MYVCRDKELTHAGKAEICDFKVPGDDVDQDVGLQMVPKSSRR